MTKTGTTCFCDIGLFHHHEVLDQLQRVGLREITGRGYLVDKESNEVPPDWKGDWKKRLYAGSHDEFSRTIGGMLSRYRGLFNSRIRMWVTLEGISTCSGDLCLGAKRLAQEYGVGICYHDASSIEEAKVSERETGEWRTCHLNSIGMLGPNRLAVHAPIVKDEEVDMLARHDVKMAHCPSAAMRIGKGVARWGCGYRVPYSFPFVSREVFAHALDVGLPLVWQDVFHLLFRSDRFRFRE